MKKLFAPHLHRHVVLGAVKLPDPEVVKNLPHLAKYRMPQMHNLPAAVAYNAPAMSVITNLEGNDAFGDCVEAEEAHYIALLTGNAGKLFSYTVAQTEAMYSALTSPPFDPKDPSTDTGTDPVACMNYFTTTAYADGTKNAGFLIVDATNKNEVEYAISTFGNLKIWLALPDSYVNPFPAGNGFVWDVDSPNPENGHCIGSCGYISSGGAPTSVQVLGVSALGVLVVTWGLIGTITWAAFAALCVSAAGGGCAVRISKDWIAANGSSPNGLSMAQLIADFEAIGGSLPTAA
jgi:hypothetical protein